MRTRAHPAAPIDDVRRAAVIVAAVLAAGGVAWNREAPDPSATLLSPAAWADVGRIALSAGLLVLAVYQTLPRQAARERMQSTGWWIAAGALSFATAQILDAPAVMGAALAVATLLFAGAARGLFRYPAERRTEALTVDLVVGLALGLGVTWSASTIALAFAEAGHPVGRTTALIALGALGAVAVLTGHLVASRPWLAIGCGAGIGWTLAGIAVARFADVPGDETVAVAAAGIASIAIVSPWVSALRERPVG